MSKRQTFLDLVHGVARHLGPGWEMDTHFPHEDRADLVHSSGWRLFVISGGAGIASTRDSRRVEITGKYHRRQWYNLTSDRAPRITVAKDRGAATIVKEIRRRLLPAYEAFYNKLEAACDQHEQKLREEAEAMDLIVEVARGTIPGHLNRDWPPGNLKVSFGDYNRYDWPYGRVYRFFQGRLQMELDYLTPEEAKAVLETLIALRSNK